MDILFLALNEPHSLENWRLFKQKFPHAQKILTAQPEANLRAVLSERVQSDYVFLVNGHSRVVADFNFSPPSALADDTVFLWKSYNSSNNLSLFFFGISLMPSQFLKQNGFPSVISFPGEHAKLRYVNTIASHFNFESPFYAWRAAFLETLNLAFYGAEHQKGTPHQNFVRRCCALAHKIHHGGWAAKGALAAQTLARYASQDKLITRYSDDLALEKEFQVEKRLAGKNCDPKVEHCAEYSDLYSSFGMNGRRIYAEKYHFYSDVTDVSAMGDLSMYNLLQQCYQFKTINEHATDFCAARHKEMIRTLSRGKSRSRFLRLFSPLFKDAAGQDAVVPIHKVLTSSISNSLAQIVSNGFLVSDSYIKREIFRYLENSRTKEKSCQKAVQSINIPTKNRPALLKRALESYAENAAEYGRRVKLHVVDDSTDRAVMEENKKNLASVVLKYGMAGHYTSRENRKNFAALLQKATGISQECCEFCLLGSPDVDIKMGASRNTIQLLTVGEFCVQVDDDTVCHCFPSQFHENGVALSSRKIYDYIFHAKEPCHGTSNVEYADFIGLHEQLLDSNITRPVFQNRLSSAKKLNIRDLDSLLLRKVCSHSGRIRATFLGSFGDSGEGNSVYRLFMKGRAFEELVANELLYDKLLCTRYATRFVPMLVVTDAKYCMTMNIGLDNSVVPIPFSPVQRNEDAVFAHLYYLCYADGLMAHQPFVLHHAPPPRPAFEKEKLFTDSTLWGLNDLFNALISRFNPSGKDAFARLSQVGHFLADVANDKDDLENQIQNVYREEIIQKLNLAYETLDRHGNQFFFWRNDMLRFARALEDSLQSKSRRLLADLHGDFPGRLQQCRYFLNKFGQMLLCWKDIVQATELLKEKGILMGTEI